MFCLQAKAGKFADAADLQPVFWLRGQEPRILPADVSLRQAGAPANVSIDLAVTFPRLRPLPHANRVPDPSSGVPTRPPGAFTVTSPSAFTTFHYNDQSCTPLMP